MSIERFFTTPVTIIEPGAQTTRYGDVAPDWDNPTSETDTAGWLTQTNTVEEIGGRDVTVTGWVLFLPVGTSVSAIARVVSGTTVYEVDGEPDLSPQTPAGKHHVEVRLRAVGEVIPDGDSILWESGEPLLWESGEPILWGS